MSGTGGGTPGGAAGPGSEHTSVLEWCVAALGLVLVLLTVGVMIADLRHDRRPPDIVVRIDSVRVLPDGRARVHFTAENRGHETAAEVSVVGEVADGAETSRQTIDYLPGQSRRSGALFFTHSAPRPALRLRAEGYREP